ARILSVVCATSIIALLFLTAKRIFGGEATGRARWFALTSSVILMGNPLFIATSGRSWNHDVPTLLMLCAALLLTRLKRSTKKRWISLLIGVLVGLCVGLRITFAPAVLAVLLVMVFTPHVLRHDRLRMLAAFGAGLSIALLPLLAIIAIAPHQFIFSITR